MDQTSQECRGIARGAGLHAGGIWSILYHKAGNKCGQLNPGLSLYDQEELPRMSQIRSHRRIHPRSSERQG